MLYKHICLAVMLVISFSSEAQVLINEICTGNDYSLLDNDHDSPDWIELYNTGETAVNLKNYTLSDDTINPGKWKFPSLNINPGEYLTIFASGKNWNQKIDHWETLIHDTTLWKYTIPAANIAGWNLPDFNDAGWLSGIGGIGYRNGDDNTIISTTSRVFFMRRQFDIADTSTISALVLNMDYEDGFVAYLNGVEIARANVNGNPPGYNQTAVSNVGPRIVNGQKPTQFIVPTETWMRLLKNGTNILAVQVHRSGGGNSMSARPFLHAALSTTVNSYYANPDWFVDPGLINNVHTNFSIKNSGDELILSDSSGIRMDLVKIPALERDHSLGRETDGLEPWKIFTQTTPSASNNTQTGYTGYYDDEVFFSHPAGFYEQALQLILTPGKSESEIRYTLDGTKPTAASILYTGPLDISATTVVKAACFKTGEVTSSHKANTYLVNESFSLPVFSLSSAPDNFFGATGIYTNYTMDWEIEAHMEYFDTDGAEKIEQDLGIKIYGAASREHAMKSLRLIARNKYGKDKITFPFFDEKNIPEFEQLVLRNGGNDFNWSHFRDALNHRVLSDKTEVDFQAYQPVIVFINGIYYGIHNLRERIGNEYIVSNHGIQKDSVDVLEKNGAAVDGNSDDFNAFVDFIRNNSLVVPENYRYVTSQLHLENFVDYFTSHIYHVNWDWPHNNIKFWKKKNGGKWRYLYYDTEFGLSLYNDTRTPPTMNDLSRVVQATDNVHSEILRALLTNPDFKNYFINRFADLMNTIYTPANYAAVMDSIVNVLQPEMPRHLTHWSAWINWPEEVELIRTFINARPAYSRSHVNSQFLLGGQAIMTFTVQIPGSGKIKVSTIVPEEYPWSGVYFTENLVTLKAFPEEGFEFSHWTVDAGSNPLSTTAEIVVDPSVATYTAHFSPTTIYGKLALTEINYNSALSAPSADWLEIQNIGEDLLNLKDWYIKDEVIYNKFIFPDITLQPGEYLVLCSDTSAFKAVNPTVKNYIGNLGFNLSNDGEEIRIYNNINDLKIHLRYNDKAPWPFLADGFGATLEYKGDAVNPSDAVNWFEGCKGGSPGKGYEPCSCSEPLLGADRLLCVEGGVVELNAGLSPGTNRNFTWYYNGMELTGLNVPAFSVSAQGEYRVVYDSVYCLKTDVVFVKEDLSFSLGADEELCVPSYLTLPGPGNFEGVTYRWKRDGVDIGDGTAILVKRPGLYTLQVDAFSCSSVSDTIHIISDLAVPHDSVFCQGAPVWLRVSGNGGYKWFDAEKEGNVVGKGHEFTVQNISSTTTYYVADTSVFPFKVGKANITAPAYTNRNFSSYKAKFTVHEPVQLSSILIYHSFGSGVTIRITDPTGLSVIDSRTFTLTPGDNSAERVMVNFHLEPGDYIMDAVGTTAYLSMEDQGGIYPYSSAQLSITGISSSVSWEQTWYPYFYDWEIQVLRNECDRVPVTAFVEDCPVTATIDQNNHLVKVFPNPSANCFNISIPASDQFEYRILNMQGQLLESGKMKTEVGKNLPPGVYFLRVEMTDRTVIQKLVKK